MNCKDCGEHIGETERRVSIACKGCGGSLHAECAMYSDNEDAFCELCLGQDTQAWRKAMKLEGAQA